MVPMLLGPTNIRPTRQTVRRIDAPDKTRLLFNKCNPSTAIFKDRRNYAQAMDTKALKNHLRNPIAYALADGWCALHTKAGAELSALGYEIGRAL